ncbi:MAG: elongation factor Ts [Clostridiales bacterium]|jgi:elongation factor Ts|nr:elongation factor Ts [Clostridiales bacterium]
MAFTASDVKNLREMTGVGMMDCKKALTEADGDIDKAVEYLREKGLATAQKKAGRIAAEGVCRAYVSETGEAAVVEVNIETDFAAKNEDFQRFAEGVAEAVAMNNPADVDALMAMTYPGSKMTVTEMQQDKILVIGENIKVRRFTRYSGGVSVPYIHMGGKIGVLVNMDVSDNIKDNPIVQELGKDLAMQIAAMRPLYLDKSIVSEAVIDKEREIQLAKAIEENKAKNLPDDKARQVAEKMVIGRINKFYEEMCLMQQAYVKESKITVEKHVAEIAKELGGTIKVAAFARFETGEGIEKKSDNFADEVAGMVK